ncbi:MAG: cytochrome C [Sulfurimonas sp.]|uniref:c-type cytochrome n=1 Tax=Sulfurimonas sp. TaxID=2022749 RepID=UPI0028CD3275|nr:cytochrome C [Sulfurimonas sp.]MDT8339334.1 cytochrome C [Sulfurimonas sp.]
MKKIILSIVALGATTALMAAVNAAACTGCHGADWSKAALGKSKNVSEMSKADIAVALKGYKDGSYGGPMKGLMKGQVDKYSNEELDAFAQTIGK